MLEFLAINVKSDKARAVLASALDNGTMPELRYLFGVRSANMVAHQAMARWGVDFVDRYGTRQKGMSRTTIE